MNITTVMPYEAAQTVLRVCEGAIKIDTSLMQQLGVKQITKKKLSEHKHHLEQMVQALKRAGVTP